MVSLLQQIQTSLPCCAQDQPCILVESLKSCSLLGNIQKNVCMSHKCELFPTVFKSEKLKRIAGTEERRKREDTPKHFYCCCQLHSIRNLSWESSVRPMSHDLLHLSVSLGWFGWHHLTPLFTSVSQLPIAFDCVSCWCEACWAPLGDCLTLPPSFLLIILLVALHTFTHLQAHSSCSGNNFRIWESSFSYKWTKMQNAVKIK